MKSKAVRNIRLGAAALTAAAIALTMLVSLPSRSAKSSVAEDIETAKASTEALETRLQTYIDSGLTAEEFAASVAVLDAEIPYLGENPTCDDGTDPLALQSAQLNPSNIKFALHDAAIAQGLDSDVANYVKTEVAAAEAGRLQGFAVPVTYTAEPSVINALVDDLESSGFMVTADTVSVTVEAEIGSEGSTMVSARLVFWYTTTPGFYLSDIVSTLCEDL